MSPGSTRLQGLQGVTNQSRETAGWARDKGRGHESGQVEQVGRHRRQEPAGKKAQGVLQGRGDRERALSRAVVSDTGRHW